MVEIEDLKCCGMFGGLSSTELAALTGMARTEKVSAGTRIIKEGTPANALYLLKEGRAAVRMTSRDGHEVVIDQLQSGDVFGWSAVLESTTFKSAIWALEDCSLIVVDGGKLRELLETTDHMGYRVVRGIAGVVANRLEKLRARLVDQPFSEEWLTPTRVVTLPVTGEKTEMGAMPCPECSVVNRPFAIVNETQQYRCKKCGMVYYSPLGCETGPITASASKPRTAPQLAENWRASSPGHD